MGSDFSALDAELDTLGAGTVVDALALAASYAGNLAALSDIDAALGMLDSEHVARHVRPSDDTSMEVPNFLAGISGERVARRPRAGESEEIVLPDPVLGSRADLGHSTQRNKADQSGELPLDAGTPRSGSFSLEGAGILPGNRDDTIETTEEELAEADVDLIDMRPESAPMLGMPPPPNLPSLFERNAHSDNQAQKEADAAFAELFADATRQSQLPAARHSQPPPAPYAEDTEIFDTGSVGYVESLAESQSLADTIAAEELDSAEFEIVLDDDSNGRPPVSPSVHPSQHPSQPPEKRPSFLGRLFGRKEE